jgi:tRNA pseudouridine32 synthase/23S rRNA pseudouridine746 synthase
MLPLNLLLLPLNLLFADDALLALDKPSGLLSVPGRGQEKQDCLAARARKTFPDALVVHRLDMATSGIFLMARGKVMQSALNRLFAERQVEKHYEAILEGRLAQAEGEVDLPLICDWPHRPRQMVCFQRGKPSRTEFLRLGYDPERDRTRVRLIPHTGRSHQLRVHMQAIGHPILGDEFYATPAGYAAAPRLLLHACRLALAHPASGQPLTLVSPPPF